MNNKKKEIFKRRINQGLKIEDLEDTFIDKAMNKQWLDSARKLPQSIPPMRKNTRSRRFISLWVSSAVAAVATLVVLFNMFSGEVPISAEVMFSFASNNHSVKHILPDSSTVLLSPHTKISYDSSFNERKIILEGSAIFDVTHNSKRPFSVLSEKSSIEVLGTSFSVDNTCKDNIVHLYSGKIVLNFNNNKIAVSPNERVILDTEKLQYSVEKDNTIQWVNNQYRFNAITLSKLIHFINQNYDCDIEVKSLDLEYLFFTGSISYDEPIEQIVEKISFTLDLKPEKISINKFILN